MYAIGMKLKLTGICHWYLRKDSTFQDIYLAEKFTAGDCFTFPDRDTVRNKVRELERLHPKYDVSAINLAGLGLDDRPKLPWVSSQLSDS